jgi:hypothetical protein
MIPMFRIRPMGSERATTSEGSFPTRERIVPRSEGEGSEVIHPAHLGQTAGSVVYVASPEFVEEVAASWKDAPREISDHPFRSAPVP